MNDTNPYARARFAGSVARLSQLPPDSGIEVAFAGRSNAGKSSALNALAGRQGLARTSKTPGRTQLINLFDVPEGARLVDLPGYGYARVNEATRRQWTQLLGAYLRQRRALRGLVLVVDIRRGLTQLDWDLLALIAGRPVALHVLLTKADKLSRSAAQRTLEQARTALEEAGFQATLQCFSATRRAGVEDLRGLVEEWLTGA